MQLDENLSYTKQLVAIVDKCVKHLHSKDVVSVKVAWRGPVGEEMTREPEIITRENKVLEIFEILGVLKNKVKCLFSLD